MAAMGENDALVKDQKVVVAHGGSSQNSPWKKPVLVPAESPVMGEKVWPALANVLSAKAAETQVTQKLDGHKKSNNEGANGNSSHKWQQRGCYRGRPKKSQYTGPPFPVPVVPGVAYPPPGSFLPPVRGPEFFYQPMPAPFPIANNSFSKSGSQIPVKAFSSPMPVMGDGQDFQPPARRDQPVNPPKYSVERTHTTAEVCARGYGHMYNWCSPPRPLPYGTKGSITMQENMAPRASIRPTFARPSAFIGGPPFPGPGNVHYRPMHPPVFIRAPYPPWIRCPQPELPHLKEAIVKQIEYYFSDENLLTDHYLLSQMDDQGWVSISVIADFKRVRRMCRDIHFILDALQWSSSVEVQGYNLRKSVNTSRITDKSPAIVVKNNFPCEDSTGDNIRSVSESGAKVDISSDNKHTYDVSPESEESDIKNSPLADSSAEIDALTEGMEQLLYSAANIEKLPNVMSSGLYDTMEGGLVSSLI